MSRRPYVPRDLGLLPFRGSDVVARALLTRAQLRGPTWRRLFPDVYIASDVPLDHRMWCHAALVYAGSDESQDDRNAVISGYSAAYAWGVDLLPGPDTAVEMTVPPGINVRSRPPYLIVRHAQLTMGDRGVAGVLRTTSPLRTAFDLARHVDRVDAVVALDAFAHRRLVTVVELAEYALAHPALSGSRGIPEVLALVEPLTESPMETRLRVALIDGGLPRPVAQVEVRDGGGRLIGRVDLAYPEHRVGIEYEGDHHRDSATFRADLLRANAMHVAGWILLRVTHADMYPNTDKLIEAIRWQIRPS